MLRNKNSKCDTRIYTKKEKTCTFGNRKEPQVSTICWRPWWEEKLQKREIWTERETNKKQAPLRRKVEEEGCGAKLNVATRLYVWMRCENHGLFMVDARTLWIWLPNSKELVNTDSLNWLFFLNCKWMNGWVATFLVQFGLFLFLNIIIFK